MTDDDTDPCQCGHQHAARIVTHYETQDIHWHCEPPAKGVWFQVTDKEPYILDESVNRWQRHVHAWAPYIGPVPVDADERWNAPRGEDVAK